METYSAGQNGDYLRIRSHFGRKENNSYEYEQRAEHIHEIRYKIHVVAENNFIQRGLFRHKLVNLFAYIENDDDANDEQKGDEEGEYELLRYIQIQLAWD